MMFFHRHKGDLGAIRGGRAKRESCDRVGVMENSRKRKEKRVFSPRREKKKERVEGGECARHYLYSCVSSADDIMLAEKKTS